SAEIVDVGWKSLPGAVGFVAIRSESDDELDRGFPRPCRIVLVLQHVDVNVVSRHGLLLGGHSAIDSVVNGGDRILLAVERRVSSTRAQVMAPGSGLSTDG